jgi:Mn-dependent DtxR family transcriptional regulator
MIKNILNQIALGNISMSELAEALNITRTELSNRLDTLENMGYISKLCDGPTKERKKCSTCSMVNTCQNTSEKISYVSVYELTKKGKRACNAPD